MVTKKKWSEMSGAERAGALTVGSIELALTAAALADLVTRPAEQVRGGKWPWALGIFVQPIGPIAYLVWGRHAPLPAA